MRPLLLLIDLQFDFLRSPALEPAASSVVQRVATLLRACRAAGVPVVHVWTTVSAAGEGRMPHWKQSGKWACVVGTEGHATPEALRPLSTEAVVHKTFYSAFSAVRLGVVLRESGADRLWIAGVHLHGCVRVTAVDAYQKGWPVWIAEDAVASNDPMHAATTQRYLAERGIHFATVDDLRGVLGSEVGRLDEKEGPATAVPASVIGDVTDHASGLTAIMHASPSRKTERWRVVRCGEEQIERVAEAFQSTESGSDERLFLTGDLGRMRSDGCLEPVGRKDSMVKVRGHRVELGEVEGVLTSHEAVREVVVIPRNDPNGATGLVAYVVCAGSAVPTVTDLRRFLADRLPGYMIPAYFVALGAVPRLPNGKVDSRALPSPGPDRPSLAEDFAAPRDELERRLARLWEAELDVRPIGVRDPFTELGGDSLTAVALLARIEQTLGTDLPMAALYEAATIEGMARAIQEGRGERSGSGPVALQPHGDGIPFFCVPGAGSDVTSLAPLARHLGTERPFYGLQHVGLDGRRAPHKTVEEMAAFFVEGLRTIRPTGSCILGGSSFGGVVAFEMARQLAARNEGPALVALLDAYAPGYPRSWPRLSVRQRIALFMYELRPVGGKHERSLRSLARAVRLRGNRYWAGVVAPAYRFLGKALPLHYRYRLVQDTSMGARRSYQAGRYGGQVALLRVEVQPPEDLFEPDPSLGWNRLVDGHLEIRSIPGRHIEHIREPNVAALAAELRSVMAGVQNSPP